MGEGHSHVGITCDSHPLSLTVCASSTLLAHTDALGRTRERRNKKEGERAR